jgi:uncharacterized protein (DUF1697 family)
MQTYIAFLSGLPTGKNAIAPDDLRAAITRLGFMDVKVLLTSGNVAFSTAPVGVIAPLEAQISRHLRKQFDLEDVWTFIRTPREIEQVIAAVPFSQSELDDKGNSIYVLLLSRELDDLAARRIQVRRTEVDVLKPAGSEVYWLRRADKGEHVAPPSLSELIDGPATVRSLHTMRQILEDLHKPVETHPKLVKLADAIRSERSRQ